MNTTFYHCDPQAGEVYESDGTKVSRVNGRGYVEMSNGGGTYFGLAHRFIWESVHGQIPDGMQVNHINGIKTDNRLANLELVTPSGNTAHAYQLGLRSAKGEQNGRARLSEEDVRAIRDSTDSSTELAKRYGVARRTVRDVRSGRNWGEVA